jgi:DNA-binding CsgD family transcriptional regulator
MDGGGVFRWVNPAMAALVGDVVGRSYTTVIAPESLALASREVARKLTGEARTTDFPLMMVGPSRRRIPVRIQSVSLEVGGAIVGILGAAIPQAPRTDVRERDRTAEMTGRQLEVLRLLGEGLTTAQIAVSLGVTAATVRNHIRAVLRELGAHSRLEAVVVAYRVGLLQAPEPPER